MDRNETIKRIRAGLKRRTGRSWSVTGGRGTAWGWIKIDAPPARRTFQSVPKPSNPMSLPGAEGWEWKDTGEPGHYAGPEDCRVLAEALGLDAPAHFQGVSVPASSDYYREYVERAEGTPVTKKAVPYWD